MKLPTRLSNGINKLRGLVLQHKETDLRHKYQVLHIPEDMFTNLVHLRILHLRAIRLQQLPKTIGKLLILRYLNHSQSEIQVLPKSLCKLINLQVLDLSHCEKLENCSTWNDVLYSTAWELLDATIWNFCQSGCKNTTIWILYVYMTAELCRPCRRSLNDCQNLMLKVVQSCDFNRRSRVRSPSLEYFILRLESIEMELTIFHWTVHNMHRTISPVSSIKTGYFNSSIRLFRSSCFERHHQHSADAYAELPVRVNGAGGALVLVLQDLPAHRSTPLGGAGVEHHAAHALCKIRRHAHRHQQHQGHREHTNASISHYSLKCDGLRGTKHRLI